MGIQNIHRALAESDDLIMFVEPTGGGKTPISFSLIQQSILNGKRTMFIAHREKLIRQAHKTAMRYKLFSGIIMGQEKTNYEFPSQVCSIQTIIRRKNLPPADRIIIDEAHHVTDDNSYGSVLEEHYPHAEIIMVTATPYRLSGDGFRNIMSTRKTRLIVNGTTKERIEQGWLVPFDYYAYAPDMDGAKTRGGEFVEEESMAKMKMAPVVQSYFDHAEGLQGTCFGINVKHCHDLAKEYTERSVACAVVTADTPQPERDRIIADYCSGLLKIVINCDIYTEGADFPFTQFVQDAAPTKALNKFLQRCGRGTRAEEGLVDQFKTAEERRAAIALSSKPYNIILDNAGNFTRHMFPDYEHDWEHYFNGTRGEKREKKEQEMMEILVYEAEDENGKIVRTKSPREIEGMKLVRVTKEVKQTFVRMTSLKQFDRIYDQMQVDYARSHTSYPGVMALNTYIRECRRTGTVIDDNMWDYFQVKLIDRIEQQLEALRYNGSMNPAMPVSFYEKQIANLKRLGISKATLAKMKKEYIEKQKQGSIF